MTMNDNDTRTRWYGLAMVLITAMGAVACASTESELSVGAHDETSSAASKSPVEDRIEGVVRDIETGQRLDEARTTLDQILADPAATSDERDDARLALSRLHEVSGDKEAAVRVVEELLSSHPVSSRFAARSLAEKRLRFLLTGTDQEGPSYPPQTTVAPVAKALADHFVAGENGTTRIQVLIFGPPSQDEKPLGTFNIAGALREQKREACPLCNDSVSVSTSRSRTSSWVSIPAAAADSREEPSISDSLTVFYYDLESNRVPSRYDSHLPLPSDEIAAQLDRGDGLIAVKTRVGAPPVILLAAPRRAMLPEVEEALAKMTTLPTSPTPVSLSRGLRPNEIQAVVRDAHPELRACYETYLAAAPEARGKVVMSFGIEPDGSAVDARATEASTLQAPSLHTCFAAEFLRMEFPATGQSTTVKYPISLSPSTD